VHKPNGSDPLRPSSSATTDRPCAFTMSDGATCGARRLAGRDFCFFHDPKSVEKRENARRSGGKKNRPTTLPPTTPDVRLLDGQGVARLLEQTINQVRRGEIDPKIGTTIGYLAG
jgi:hypothetical protein